MKKKKKIKREQVLNKKNCKNRHQQQIKTQSTTAKQLCAMSYATIYIKLFIYLYFFCILHFHSFHCIDLLEMNLFYLHCFAVRDLVYKLLQRLLFLFSPSSSSHLLCCASFFCYYYYYC